jgi:serine/threonine protein kinase
MTRLDDAALLRLRDGLGEPDLTGTRYRILGVAGRGGMGTVYEVHDAELERDVALKVLDLEDGAVAARLRQEARILACLEHPGIVPVHEVGTLADGRTFCTMKLVRGERLDRHVARVDSLTERLRIFLRIADAVAFAHSRGVLHRDLKPENVMVGSFGEVLVLDWGLAKVRGSPTRPALGIDVGGRPPGATGEGAVLGTPGFMSPEQEQGRSGEMDERADVFSLGAILRALLPDRPPRAALAMAAKATAPRREDRYPDVLSLAADVVRFLDGAAVSAFHEGLLHRALRLARRHRAALGILAAYLIGRGLILLFTRR